MSEQFDDDAGESLSSFLDGEIGPEEQARLTTLLAGDPALGDKMSRYQVISESLHQGHMLVNASSVADAVRRRMQDEPTILAPAHRIWPRRLPRVALGAALAAAVAAVAVSVAPQFLDPGSEPSYSQTFAFTPRLSVPAVDATTVALGGAESSSMTAEQEAFPERWKVLKPGIRNKLDGYLLEHNEFAGRLGGAHHNVHVGFISTRDAQD